MKQSKHCEVDMILTWDAVVRRREPYQFGLHIQEEVQKRLNKGWMLCAAPVVGELVYLIFVRDEAKLSSA
jgi:hypothetical protein